MSPLRRLLGRRTDGAEVATDPVAAVATRLDELREAGWVLPPSLQRDDVVPSWTRLGVIDGERCAVVDSRGLVTPDFREPAASLDWWVGAEDRWYAPAQERGVTQRRIEGAPVIETTLRVPGGEVVHRAFAARGPRYPGSDAWTVVEVENRSPVPVVVAWVVRPCTPVGLTWSIGAGFTASVAGEPQGPQLVEADDPIGVLRRPPSRWAFGEDGVDPFVAVAAGEAMSGPMVDDLNIGDDPQLRSIALLTPVPHTATTRVALFAGLDIAGHPTPEESVTGMPDIGWPAELPEAASVARGWGTLADRGPRVELPDPVLAEAVAAARRSLPLSHRLQRWVSDDDQTPPEHRPVVTADDGDADRPTAVAHQMEILAATSTWGDAATVDRALARWPEGQQRGGGFGSPEATALALRALAAHAVATGDVGPAQAWLPELGGAVESLGKVARRLPDDVDATAVAEGLDSAALLLVGLDQGEAGARVAADATRCRASAPVGPRDAALDLDAPATTPRAVAAAAVAATRAGTDASAVWALLRRASATWTWSDPERWRGDDGLVHARLLDAVARLLVTDHPDGVALTPWMPPEWWGLGWEVHDLPTRWGRLSYGVRWHGDRPAVLWDLGPAPLPASREPVVSAPGLAATWSSTERRGEALLDAVPRPAGPADVLEPDGATGTRGVAIAAPPRSVWRPQDAGPDAPADAEPPDEASDDLTDEPPDEASDEASDEPLDRSTDAPGTDDGGSFS